MASTGSSPAHSQIIKPWHEARVPNSVGYRLKILSQLMSRRLQEQLEPYKLTPFHWLVLNCLWEQDGLPTLELGERLRQVGGTLTGVLDRMEERGLVRRERDSQDRRIYRIWLTDAGRALEAILPEQAWGVREQLLQGFSDAEKTLLSEWIDRMIANLS